MHFMARTDIMYLQEGQEPLIATCPGILIGDENGFDGVLKPRSSQANGHERLKLDR